MPWHGQSRCRSSWKGRPGTSVGIDHRSGSPLLIAAVYPGGDLLINEFTFQQQLGITDGLSYLLRQSSTGTFTGAMGATIATNRPCQLPDSTLSFRGWRVFCTGPGTETSPNGKFAVTVRTPTIADPGHYTVTNIGERGDTIFSRSYPFAGVPVTPQQLDSAVDFQLSFAHWVAHPMNAEGFRSTEAAIRTLSPTVQAPVLGPLLAGDDGTVWLHLEQSRTRATLARTRCEGNGRRHVFAAGQCETAPGRTRNGLGTRDAAGQQRQHRAVSRRSCDHAVMRVVRVALVPLLLATAPLDGQAVPALQAVRDLTIDGRNAGFDRDARISVSANGTIAVAEVQGSHVVLVDREMRKVQVMGTPGDKPGAINVVQWFGWVGDSLWVADLRVNRITLFAPDHSVLRTLSLPLAVEGPPGSKVMDHSRMPPIVTAIYADGSLLISEFFLGIPNATGSYLLRTSVDGQYRGAMGSTGKEAEYCRAPTPGLSFTSMRVYCRVPEAMVAPGGRFKAGVQWPIAGDSSYYSVTNVGEKGDTIYTSTILFQPVPVSRHDVDTVVARYLKGIVGTAVRSSADSAKMDAAMHASAGTVRPAVLNLLVGNDGTVWLETPSVESGHQWLELDAKGKPVGTITVPGNVRLRQAEHGTVWGQEIIDDNTVNIVRYHITLPPRP